MKTLPLLALAALLVTSSPRAEMILDFTSNAWLDKTETVGGITASLSGIPNDLTFINDSSQIGNTSKFDGTGSLAEQFDGIGVGDDEIGGSESVLITFDQAVAVTGMSFLDLFTGPTGAESVRVEFWNDNTFSSAKLFTADKPFATAGGWYSDIFSGVIAEQIRVSYASDNDGAGVGDAALAAVQMSVVPVPAAFWLFLSALAGMTGVGRMTKP